MRFPRPIAAFLRQSDFRTAACLWLLLGGLCVFLANAIAAAFS